ncbi:MAG: hypothetical protein ACR2FX_07100 [Chthoniobacterales bacterium]
MQTKASRSGGWLLRRAALVLVLNFFGRLIGLPNLSAADLSSPITVNTRIGPMRHVVRYALTPDIPREVLARCPVGHGSFAIDISYVSGNGGRCAGGQKHWFAPT